MLKNYLTFSRFTLFVALCISAIAAYYSVIGLSTIFAGAVIPIIVMGTILEISKITTTVWLHRYWNRASFAIKTYLTTAVIALAFLTSMGIFGLLSKAHSDQGLVSGDVQSQVALLDEKIKTQRDNIEVARKALAQMDAQVDQRLARGDTESGAERAVQIRRQQARERGKLQAEIATAQKEIAKLNEQRAPIASQLRKVEAEVGPIKYIAALIYGDNPDVTLLERAVRWVTILIVLVFDPLAIILILAANNSLKWEREDKETKTVTQAQEPMLDTKLEEPLPEIKEDEVGDPIQGETDEWLHKIRNVENSTPWPDFSNDIPETEKELNFKQADYVTNYTINEPVIKTQLENTIDNSAEMIDNNDVVSVKVEDEKEVIIETAKVVEPVIETTGVTKKADVFSTDDTYVTYEGKSISTEALRQLHPKLVVDGPIINDILFGTKFPPVAKVGDIYTRTDTIPHRTYKFNGVSWIQISRKMNTSYLQNIAYVQYLISRIDSGEYDPELLSEIEQEEISNYLKNTA